MRTFTGVDPSNIVSPIKYVMKYIPEAIINIAPERKDEFEKLYPDLCIEYFDDYRWQFNVNVESKHIYLSTKAIEIMWCAAYAYMLIYTKHASNRLINKKKELIFSEDIETENAVKLLRWAYETWINEEEQPWPEDLPQPILDAKKGSMENVADELCIGSIAFMIHHELAHIRLKHDPQYIGTEQESEADSAATAWVLEDFDDANDPKFVKRSICAAIALSVIASKEVHTKNFGGDKHPPGYDRIINSLSLFINDDYHVVWAIISITLKIHLDVENIETPEVIYNSFLNCINAYANALSNIGT